MLYQFREAQAAELGRITKKQKRPALASTVDNVGECEKWRREVMREISRSVSKSKLDLNDYINKMMREKYHWEKQIKQLGGPNYSIAPKMLDNEGKEVPGSRGYKYFGRARDLPGVRELFEQEGKTNKQKEERNGYI
ncbi:unnamed protein product [Cunninghamella blakesleeana]